MGNIQVELADKTFNNVIRTIKRADVAVVMSLVEASQQRLRQLRASRDRSAVVEGVPRGSDNVDTGSVITWMSKINKDNEAAVEQLTKIWATGKARLGS
tara:strand:+ start:5886 stop:6182 length:297 start_codon:yes stop_codon:yes gene_type:complete